jgi:hypothetical protein
MLLRIRNLNGAEDFVTTFSRACFDQMRKSATGLSACFNRTLAVASVLISTASSHKRFSQCGFGWKAKQHSQALPFYSHAHQISSLFVHSLWTLHRQYSSWFSRYPQLAQASTATTVFI